MSPLSVRAMILSWSSSLCCQRRKCRRKWQRSWRKPKRRQPSKFRKRHYFCLFTTAPTNITPDYNVWCKTFCYLSYNCVFYLLPCLHLLSLAGFFFYITAHLLLQLPLLILLFYSLPLPLQVLLQFLTLLHSCVCSGSSVVGFWLQCLLNVCPLL